MASNADAELQFESASHYKGILRHFDVEEASWNLPKTGPFWDAVALAHQEGRRGAGRRIAVIDGAFDLSLGGLRDRAVSPPRLQAQAGESTGHGTAVALLIAEVVPEAKLDLYEVAVDRRPSEQLILQALREAVARKVDVINLSIGHAVRGKFATHRCALRSGVEDAVSKGAVIVVSCGNYKNALGCPAQAGGAAAVGYNTEERTTVTSGSGGAMEVTEWQPPDDYDQAAQPSFTLSQPPDVLGSSYAAPLASGLAALADDPSEITRYAYSILMSATASELDVLHGKSPTPPDADSVQLTRELHQKALNSLPHPIPMHGSRCPICAVLAHGILVNAGRFCLFTGRLPAAETLLRQAEWLAPWSADAVANLGRLIEYHAEQRIAASQADKETGALLAESEALYIRALQLRPGNPVYEAELSKIRAMAAGLGHGA